MENPITDTCRPRCCIHCPGGSLIHHGSSGLSLLLGTDGDNNKLLCAAHGIVNKFAKIQLKENPGGDIKKFASTQSEEHPAPIATPTHSKPTFSEESLQPFCSSDFFEFDKEEFSPTLWKELAGIALKKYHERQGAELELLGEVAANLVFHVRACGFHLYFQAKPNGHSPVQFFAEVFRTNGGVCHVSFCDIMDPSNPDLLKGCRSCGKRVLHPKGMEFFKFPRPEVYLQGGASS